jgi:ATP-dependent Clp protease ATP-binding subunit ClpC
MDRKIDPKVKVIMMQATKEAKALDDIKIKPEHIILSMMIDNENECVRALSIMGIDTYDLYDKVSEFARKTDLTPRISTVNRKTLPFSDDMKLIIKNLDKHCEKLNDTIIDTTHLMLGILENKLPITQILIEFGINYNGFLKTIKNMGKYEHKNNTFNQEESEETDAFRNKAKMKDTKTKTPVLDNFCRDVTKAVENGQIDPVVGREVEIERISQILSRRKKNNPVLIGEPGVGKTAIVEGLAQLIYDGNAPRTLTSKRIYSLDLGSIVAGTKYRGQFEERMKAILEECKANPEIVLFIDELHTIIGAGNASGSLDASNIFKPALARGEIQIIGATTLDEYRENIEKDGALTRRFQEVIVEEPTLEETKIILMNIKSNYETHHKVKYTEEAIDECVKLSARYIMDRAMPDKAIDVLDEAGSRTNVKVDKPENIKALELRKKEIEVEKRIVVKQQQYEEAAKLRDEEREINDNLEQAIFKWNESLDKDITIIGPEMISEIISMITKIPISKLTSQESKRLLNLDADLTGKVIGQDLAVSKVVKAIKRNRIGLKDVNKPVGSFIFLGQTGVGKTLLAKLLAEEVYGDAEALIRLDMSEYMEKFSVSKLVGPPPGYVGYEQGGQLTEKVRRKQHCVVLFDEIEKAHEDVFNMLLQLLDDGHLTDGLGRKVSFKNALIIMTSNVGAKEVNNFGKSMGFETANNKVSEETKVRDIISKALKKKFKPEFLNRIDEPIVFNSLSREDIRKIINLEIKKLSNRLAEIHFQIDISDEAMDFLASEGYDDEYGARPLNRAIQHYVEDLVADEILAENIKEGETIHIVLNESKSALMIKPQKKTKKVV